MRRKRVAFRDRAQVMVLLAVPIGCTRACAVYPNTGSRVLGQAVGVRLPVPVHDMRGRPRVLWQVVSVRPRVAGRVIGGRLRFVKGQS